MWRILILNLLNSMETLYLISNWMQVLLTIGLDTTPQLQSWNKWFEIYSKDSGLWRLSLWQQKPKQFDTMPVNFSSKVNNSWLISERSKRRPAWTCTMTLSQVLRLQLYWTIISLESQRQIIRFKCSKIFYRQNSIEKSMIDLHQRKWKIRNYQKWKEYPFTTLYHTLDQKWSISPPLIWISKSMIATLILFSKISNQ